MNEPQPDRWIVPDWPAPAGVRALITTRWGGLSTGRYGAPSGSGMNIGLSSGDDRDAVLANRARLRDLLPAEPRWLHQVHGARVVDVGGLTGPVEADAAITDRIDIVAVVTVADCLPVLLTDELGTCVGVAHAGWRGLAAGVVQTTVGAIRERAGSGARLIAFLGPAIGPDHFEVGAEVRDAMTASLGDVAAQAFAACGSAKFRADLFALARMALAAEAVDAVYGGGVCTYCDPGRFYSYRRDRVTGRHAALVWRAAGDDGREDRAQRV